MLHDAQRQEAPRMAGQEATKVAIRQLQQPLDVSMPALRGLRLLMVFFLLWQEHAMYSVHIYIYCYIITNYLFAI